ncbi:hypothetical protein ACFL2H_09585, partial [Planctomycetota bacterium]
MSRSVDGANDYRDVFHARHAGEANGEYQAFGVSGSIFDGIKLTFDNGSIVYDVDSPDVLEPTGGAMAALTYPRPIPFGQRVAALQNIGTGNDGNLVMLGFPFETILEQKQREDLIGNALFFFGVLPDLSFNGARGALDGIEEWLVQTTYKEPKSRLFPNGVAAASTIPEITLDDLLKLPNVKEDLRHVLDFELLFSEIKGRLAQGASLRAENIPSSFDLPREASFFITINGRNPARVAIPTSNAPNTALTLLGQIRDRIRNAGLQSTLFIDYDSLGRLEFTGASGETVSSLSVSTLYLEGPLDVIGNIPSGPANGRLASSISSFKIKAISEFVDENSTINSTEQETEVTLGTTDDGLESFDAFTSDNATLQDLADDINRAIAAKGDLTGVYVFVDTGTDGIDVNPYGNATINDRLILAATDPNITRLEIVAVDPGLGLSPGFVEKSTNMNPAATVLRFEGEQDVAEELDSIELLLPQLEQVLRDISAESGAPLPSSYSINPEYSANGEVVEFNFQVNKGFKEPIEFDFFQEGIDLGDFGTLEVAALADAFLTTEIGLNLDIGYHTVPRDTGFSISPTTDLSDLNGGNGLSLSVGIKAANLPHQNTPLTDLNFSVSLVRDDGIETKSIALPLTSANLPVGSDNAGISSYVDDLNALFDAIIITPEVRDSDGKVTTPAVTYRTDVVEAVLSREKDISNVVTERVVLRVLDESVRSMKIDGGEAFGFSAGQESNFNDLRIVVTDQQTKSEDKYEVNLDRTPSGQPTRTVGDVISIVDTATSGRVQIEPSRDGKSFNLTAWTGGAPDLNSSVQVLPFVEPIESEPKTVTDPDTQLPVVVVDTVAGITSAAGSGLGILGDSDTDKDDPDIDNRIEGSDLDGQTILDRIYFKERDPTDSVKDVRLRFGIEVDDVDVSAALGQLSFEIEGDDAEKLAQNPGVTDPSTIPDIDWGIAVATSYKDPGTDADDDGLIYLSEDFDSQGEVLVLDPIGPNAPTKVSVDGGAYLTLGVDKITTEKDFLESITGTTPLIDLTIVADFDPNTGKVTFTKNIDSSFENLFKEIKDFDIDDLLLVVKGVIGKLQDADDLEFMTKPLPLVNKSLNEIVDFTDGVVTAVDSVLSNVDEAKLKPAIEAVETAVANIALPQADKKRINWAVEILNRLKPPYTQDQLKNADGTDTEWLDRLPGRFLSAVRNLAKSIQTDVLVQSTPPSGTQALIAARDHLIGLVPQLNTISERIAVAIEDALKRSLPAGTIVVVDIGAIPDILPDDQTKPNTLGNQKAVTVGIKLRNDNWFRTLDGAAKTFEIELPPEALGLAPLDVSLNADPELFVGGEIAVGVAARLDTFFDRSDPDNPVPRENEFLILADNPTRQPTTVVGDADIPGYDNALTMDPPQIPSKLATDLGLTNTAAILLEKELRDDTGAVVEGDRWLIRDKIGLVDEVSYVVERRDGGFEYRERHYCETHLHRTGVSLNVGFDGVYSGSISMDALGDIITAEADLSLLRSAYESETTTSSEVELDAEPISLLDPRFVVVAVTYQDGTNEKTEVLHGGAEHDYVITQDLASTKYSVDFAEWLAAPGKPDLGDALTVSVEYETAAVPGTAPDLNVAENRAQANLSVSPATSPANDIGGIRLGDLAGALELDLHSQGKGNLALGSLDAEFLGNPAENVIVVAASLDHLDQPQFYVDTDAIAGLVQNIDFDLKALIRSVRSLLTKLEEGIKDGSISELPLVGDVSDADTFVGDLEGMLGQLEMDLMSTEGDFDEMEEVVRDVIWDYLGPKSNNPTALEILGQRVGAASASNPMRPMSSSAFTPDDDVVVNITSDTFEILFNITGQNTFELGFDAGIEELPLQAEGGLDFQLDYSYDVGWGYSKLDGFYLIGNDPNLSDPNPELELWAKAQLSVIETDPSAAIPTTLEATVGDVELSVTDILTPNGDSGTFLELGGYTGSVPNFDEYGIALDFDTTADDLPADKDDKLALGNIGSIPFERIVSPTFGMAVAEIHVQIAAGIGTSLPTVQSDLIAKLSANKMTSIPGMQPELDIQV